MENKSILESSPRESLHPYEIEVERIKNELGNLEEIRLRLGLSRRQLCHLLLVDPSAWTRWSKTDAPPHVYQSLRWLVELKKRNPEAAGPTNLHVRVEQVESLVANRVQNLEKQLGQLEKLLHYWSLNANHGRTSEADLRQDMNTLKTELVKLQEQAKSVAATTKAPATSKLKTKPRTKIAHKKTKKSIAKGLHKKFKIKSKAKPKTKKNRARTARRKFRK